MASDGRNSEGLGEARYDAPPPLTFRPAFDDHHKLTKFLKGVFDKHLVHRRRTLQGQESIESTIQVQESIESTIQGQDARESTIGPAMMPRSVARIPQAMPSSSSVVSGSALSIAATSTAASCAPVAIARQAEDASHRASKKRKTSSDCAPTKPQAKSRRRARAPNNASLLRAKSIDFNAPDPEEASPPNETEDERRKRKERINGRRKRAKKMIEIDHLQEQYHTLKRQNDKLREDNSTLQGKINMIRDLERSGHIQLLPEGAGGVSEGPTTGTVIQASSSQPPASQAVSCGVQPAVSYSTVPPAAAAAAAALAPLVNQGLPATGQQQEENKESILASSHLQQVGLHGLGLSGLHGPGSTGMPALPGIPGTTLSNNQVFSHLPIATTQQQLLPLTVTLFSGLVQQQQQQQQQQQAMNLQNVQLQAQQQSSLLSPIQQMMFQLSPQQLPPAGLPAHHHPAPSHHGPQYQGHDRQPPPC